MADGSLLLIWRAQPTDVLLAQQASLMAAFTSPYSSQTVGGKNFSMRSLREIQGNLEAIQFVLNERSGDYQGTVLTDFSENPIDFSLPAGSSEQL